MEQGWEGPPYDSFQLADALGVQVVARQDLDDARLVTVDDQPRIEFNPQRRPARIRFRSRMSLATCCSETSPIVSATGTWTSAGRMTGSWRWCNVAAAELLMPAGALPINATWT